MGSTSLEINLPMSTKFEDTQTLYHSNPTHRYTIEHNLCTKSFIQGYQCIIVYKREKKCKSSMIRKCLISCDTFIKKIYDIEVNVNKLKLM